MYHLVNYLAGVCGIEKEAAPKTSARGKTKEQALSDYDRKLSAQTGPVQDFYERFGNFFAFPGWNRKENAYANATKENPPSGEVLSYVADKGKRMSGRLPKKASPYPAPVVPPRLLGPRSAQLLPNLGQFQGVSPEVAADIKKGWAQGRSGQQYNLPFLPGQGQGPKFSFPTPQKRQARPVAPAPEVPYTPPRMSPQMRDMVNAMWDARQAPAAPVPATTTDSDLALALARLQRTNDQLEAVRLRDRLQQSRPSEPVPINIPAVASSEPAPEPVRTSSRYMDWLQNQKPQEDQDLAAKVQKILETPVAAQQAPAAPAAVDERYIIPAEYSDFDPTFANISDWDQRKAAIQAYNQHIASLPVGSKWTPPAWWRR